MINSNIKLLFGTVIYKSAWKYHQEFANSLNMQSDSQFEVLVINDDVGESQVLELKKLISRNVTVVPKPHNMSIAALRVFLLSKAKQMGYDLLILGDFDDTFSANRVSEVLDEYDDTFGFYYNPIYTFSGRTVFHNLPGTLNSYVDILEHNFLGLSNTAIDLKQLDMAFIESLSEGETPVFDWYLYTRIMLKGMQGKLVENASTYYRVHENNIAGLETQEEADILKEIEVKKQHYSLLKSYTSLLQKKYSQYQSFAKEDYRCFLCGSQNGYWWEKIQLKEQKENV